MSSDRVRRGQRGERRNRALVIVLAAVVFMGVVGQITMLARVSGQQKAQTRMEQEIRVLNAQMDNMNLSINSFHNLDRVAARAKELGMGQPDESQIRVVSLPVVSDNTSTQSAEAIGAEEIE